MLSQGAVMPFFCAWNLSPGFGRTLLRSLSLSVSKLTSLIQPVVEDLGYEFVGLEHSSNPKNPALVLYIDQTSGIAVEDCEKVSREVASLLDVEDPIPGNYVLEVSSPGLDRPLFSLSHFDQFIGSVVHITLFAPVSGRRKFKGAILGTEDASVRINQDGVEVKLEFGNIAKARLVPDYERLFAGH
jgi:ribosome maturation factor RimP